MARCLEVLIVLGTLALPAWGAPYTPKSDNEIVDRLPADASTAALRETRTLHAALRQDPSNLKLAAKLARRFVDLGRASGDPRYAGYAQAALAPWWNEPAPPTEVQLLRATLRQRLHQFGPARDDLDAILKTHPRHAQARLTKATILLVQGEYEAAKQECGLLQINAPELIWAHCTASAQAASGDLAASYEGLKAVLQRHPETAPDLREWVETTLAEMSVRAGRSADAQRHYANALALDPDDQYALASYADFLLDQGRGKEVIALLKNRDRADGLMLRIALAHHAMRSPDLAQHVKTLRARFDASRLRGDRVHLREEARFTLHLLGDAQGALTLARDNWAVQKETADVRILLECAIAAKDSTIVAEMKSWLSTTRHEDIALQRLIASSSSNPAAYKRARA